MNILKKIWLYTAKKKIIEKYEMEFEPFDISLELKKYKINKRKMELENDFNG